MRVGIIAYGLDRRLTGIGRYIIEITRALAALPAGPEITLLAAGGLGELEASGLPAVPLRLGKYLPALMTVGSAQIPGIARRHQLDIVHDPVGVTPFMFGTGPAKSIVTIHDSIPWSFPGVSTLLDTLIYRRWLPYAVRRVDAVATVSAFSREDLAYHLNIPPEKIGVVYGAADPSFRPRDKDAIARVREQYKLPEDYILYVGSIETRKNLIGALEAFHRLRVQNVSHKLVIVGPAKWRYGEIMETFDRLDLTDHVIFTGYVAQADLPVIYSGASLFVFPSLYEGFGLPPLEAMASGVPVVTSTSSSLPEVVNDAALIVNPKDTDAIADAMYTVLKDPQLQETMRQKGLERAQVFSWERSAHLMMDIYRQVLNQ
ncbi:MAG: glycosyltransferase family 4 protein [Chloroflexota bacterium]